jgi:hypothetical protein
MFRSSIVSSLHAWPSSAWITQSYVPDVLRTPREKKQEMIGMNLIGIAIDEQAFLNVSRGKKTYIKLLYLEGSPSLPSRCSITPFWSSVVESYSKGRGNANPSPPLLIRHFLLKSTNAYKNSSNSCIPSLFNELQSCLVMTNSTTSYSVHPIECATLCHNRTTKSLLCNVAISDLAM